MRLLQALSQRIAAILRRSQDALPAKSLARSLGATRAEINSALYSGLGREFRIFETNPPTWAVVDSSQTQRKALTRFQQIDEEIHVDAPGGDWKMKIQISEMSVNDPVAIVESYGERSRLITVSTAVARSSDPTEEVPDACIAIASAMLAWEILTSLTERGITHLEFSHLLRDVYVSVGAHSRALSDKPAI